ncbi:MAG TPA: hypothetical protein VHS33_00190 [Sphingomicrobium sp.]|jgi:hypothetical protein|nr:hypothetical protein [Sphingomicrobium sp.]
MLSLLALAAQIAGPAVDCHFDANSLQFEGSPIEQAQCLLRPVEQGGGAGPEQPLPSTLSALIGQKVVIDPEKLSRALRRDRIPLPSTTPVSETTDHLRAIYFVIHDTSSPYLGENPFPAHFSRASKFNDVRQFLGKDAVAHLFNDRLGHVVVGHDLEVGWRATKLERILGERVRGRFLHVENLQPRREDPSGAPRNDEIAPEPGFTSRQYRTLALLYVLASARAGTWLIPAFHANIDRGIPEAHDDPQNFDLRSFDDQLSRWLERLRPATAKAD